MADINYDQLLLWSKAKYAAETVQGLTEDGKLVVFWDELAVNQLEDAKDWWKINRVSVTDPKVEYKTFEGTWRTVEVKTDRSAQRLVVTLAFGYYETIAWTNARIVQMSLSAANSQGVTGVANATSDNPGKTIHAIFPNLNPFKLGAMIGATPCTDTTVTNPVIGGETHTGVWYIVLCIPKREEDGSGSITLVLSDEIFTLAAYSRYLTSSEETVYYVHNVPKTLAQGIIDAWKAEQRSATVSYNGDKELVTLVLSTNVLNAVNLTTAWIPVSCDTYSRYHFGWGYTKAQVDAFITTHSTAIGTTEALKIIRSRKISVQTRGDSLYDVTVEEESWANTGDNTTPDFTITLPVGTKVTHQTDYGYNFSITDMNTIKTTYDTTVKAVGKSVEFRVTREDDCSFDYTAVISIVAKIDSGSLPTTAAGTAGVDTKVRSVKFATLAEMTAAILAYAPGIGKSLRANMSANDDETYNAEFVEVTAQTPEHTGAIAIDTLGLGVSVASGHNATAAEVTSAIATFTSGARKSHTVEMHAGDDGGWDYSIREQTVLATTDADIETSTGSSGISVKMRYGRNQSTEPAIVKDRLKRISGSIQAQDDGTLNHGIVEETVVATDLVGNHAALTPPTNDGIRHGTKGERVASRISLNDDPATLDANDYVSTNGTRVVLEARLDDSGNLHFTKDTITKVEDTETLKGGSFTEAETIDKSINDVGRDGFDASSAAATEGTTILWQARLDPDGSIDWDKITRTAVKKTAGDTAATPTPQAAITIARLKPQNDKYGYTDAVVVFRNVPLASLGDYDVPDNELGPPAVNHFGHIESLTMNDNGTFNGVRIDRTYFRTASVPASEGADDNATPEDISTWTRRTIIYNSDYTEYKLMTEVFGEKWDNDYSDVVDFLAGGFAEPNAWPEYKVISGRSYWWARKCTSITIGVWTEITGAITPA